MRNHFLMTLITLAIYSTNAKDGDVSAYSKVTIRASNPISVVAALHFRSPFSPEPFYTTDYANSFVSNHRFLASAATENNKLRLAVDITTIGGSNKLNFAVVARG